MLQPWTEWRREELRRRLEKAALGVNYRFDPPMNESEVLGIVRSVCRYAYEWKGFHKQIQARRNGRKGGLETQRRRRERADERRELVEALWTAGMTWRTIAEKVGVSLRTIVLDIRVIKTGETSQTEWKTQGATSGFSKSLSSSGDSVRFSNTRNRNSTQNPRRERNYTDFPMGSPVWWSHLPSEGDRFREWVLSEGYNNYSSKEKTNETSTI